VSLPPHVEYYPNVARQKHVVSRRRRIFPLQWASRLGWAMSRHGAGTPILALRIGSRRADRGGRHRFLAEDVDDLVEGANRLDE